LKPVDQSRGLPTNTHTGKRERERETYK
jgi:hypothetical protein